MFVKYQSDCFQDSIQVELCINIFDSSCTFSSIELLRKLRIWSHLLKKSLMESFIFCAVAALSSASLHLIKVEYLHLFFSFHSISQDCVWIVDPNIFKKLTLLSDLEKFQQCNISKNNNGSMFC